MAEKIYKYFSGDVLDLVFEREDFCGIRCSLPKDYNDPFELFLGVDLNVSTDLLATYREVVNEVPQFPTTCFSKSPVLSPMWAHYGRNHSGFTLGFDSDRLKERFEEAHLRNVTYKDTADDKIAGALMRSAMTMKPRHVVWLQQAVLNEAYFSKQTAWSYEQEHRLVVPPNQVEDIDGSLILYVPLDCITALIVGSRCTAEDKATGMKIASASGLEFYETVIGKSNALPFFVDDQKNVFIFDGEDIVKAEHICSGCSEPVSEDAELCAWCRITEVHEREAARANPFRVMQHLGVLDRYLEEVAEIERSTRRSRRTGGKQSQPPQRK